MEQEKDKKYYWLRLKKDFFKRHDIQIIENMPNGKDYILFYLKLLVESVDHIGELRFSDAIPYNEQMLSTITNTNIDIVRSAMKVFTELKMIEILSDHTIFMTEIEKLIGSETYWAEQKRKTRSKIGQCPTNVLEMSEQSPTCPSKSIEIEKEIEKEIKKNSSRFTPPTLEEVREYCNERNNKVDPDKFIDFYSSKGWMVGKNKMKEWKASVRTWEKESKGNQQQPKTTNKFNQFPQRDNATVIESLEEKLLRRK